MSGKFSMNRLGAIKPVEGGYEDDGTMLFIARAWAREHMHIGIFTDKTLHPGKVSPKLDGAHIAVGEKEVRVKVSTALIPMHRLVKFALRTMRFSFMCRMDTFCHHSQRGFGGQIRSLGL